jgi:pyruvyltransferase
MGWHHRAAFRLLRRRVPDPAGCLDGERIRLNWWDKVPNLGDAISPLIVAHLSGRPVVRAGDRVRGKLIGVGSILNRARDGDVVWGSGLISADARPRGRRILVKAVRGPRTAAQLRGLGIECPGVFGDPGCLLPRLFPRPPGRAPRYALGVIPHHRDMELVSLRDPAVSTLDILSSPEQFLAALWDCERVVSSSLHGIIFAEAYGIPAAWLVVSDRVLGEGHKFADYYEGTGRECPRPLSMDQLATERDWTAPAPGIAEQLATAFPFPSKAP